MDEFEYLKDSVLAGLFELERQALFLDQYDLQRQIRSCIEIIVRLQVMLPRKF